MKTKTTLASLATLSLVALMSTSVLAGQDPATSTLKQLGIRVTRAGKQPATGGAPAPKSSREPRRIFDIVKGEFIPNPDYHGPFPLR
jgi:hypothetical protein